MKKIKDHIVDAEIIETQWDKKKIAIGIVLLLCTIGAGIYSKYVYDQYAKPQHILGVQGARTDIESSYETKVPQSTVNHFTLPSSQEVANTISDKIQSLQQQAETINVQEIATSSPQIQSILREIQQLPQVPGNSARQACENICKNL